MNYESGGSKNKQNSTFFECIIVEFAVWIFVGLLWLAFCGGIWGLVISLILGGLLALLLWSSRQNTNQAQEKND